MGIMANYAKRRGDIDFTVLHSFPYGHNLTTNGSHLNCNILFCFHSYRFLSTLSHRIWPRPVYRISCHPLDAREKVQTVHRPTRMGRSIMEHKYDGGRKEVLAARCRESVLAFSAQTAYGSRTTRERGGKDVMSRIMCYTFCTCHEYCTDLTQFGDRLVMFPQRRRFLQ
jgi:hypothetical protein